MNDLVNGAFETCGFFFILPSIIRLVQDKEVKGVSLIHAGFFWIWGLWNLYYYPSLNQQFSFYGGILLFTANTIWIVLLVYYDRWPTRPRRP